MGGGFGCVRVGDGVAGGVGWSVGGAGRRKGGARSSFIASRLARHFPVCLPR
jgi:hypothetical protein